MRMWCAELVVPDHVKCLPWTSGLPQQHDPRRVISGHLRCVGAIRKWNSRNVISRVVPTSPGHKSSFASGLRRPQSKRAAAFIWNAYDVKPAVHYENLAQV